MKKIKNRNNFIIALLLVVFLITGMGVGLDENCQVFSLCYETEESVFSIPTITINGELHTFQVSERISITHNLRSMNGSRSETFSRTGLFFLCVLAILSIFLRLIQEVFTFYGRLYVYDRYYMITFMQDMDGRKRISY